MRVIPVLVHEQVVERLASDMHSLALAGTAHY